MHEKRKLEEIIKIFSDRRVIVSFDSCKDLNTFYSNDVLIRCSLMSKEERIEFYSNQIEVEKKIVAAAQKAVKGVKNPLVREMILAVAIDSQKHETMLKALLDRITGPSPAIDEAVSDEIAESIREHVELEAQAIIQYRDYLDGQCCTDNKEKIVIKAIYEDELRHHELMRWLYKTIVQKETLIEEDIWDHMWSDAFSHGTPGG